MEKAPEVARYHLLIVVMHWLVAVLVVANLAAGGLLLEPMPNDDPEKLGLIRLHLATGLSILALMVIRIAARIFTKAPASPHAEGLLRWVARINHGALYVFVIAMLFTGLGTAQLGGLFPILQGAEAALPETFADIPPYAGHVLFSTVLALLVSLHVVAVGYHHLKGEKLLSRMWFGQRRSVSEGPVLPTS